MKDTNASIEEKNRDITNKSDEKAQAEGDLTAANEVPRLAAPQSVRGVWSHQWRPK